MVKLNFVEFEEFRVGGEEAKGGEREGKGTPKNKKNFFIEIPDRD